MRDRRFVAVHRGGPLDRASQAFLARWAADCAERALPFFFGCSDDRRPQEALDMARLWAAGAIQTGVAMRAAVASHAAARQVRDKAAIAAARAAGHAVATAHAADHSLGALLYLLQALAAAGRPTEPELQLQLAKLPEHLREPVTEGIFARWKLVGRGPRDSSQTSSTDPA